MVYMPTHLKNELLEHFGSHILISSRGKKTNVGTLRTTASKILSQYFDSPRTNDAETKKLILIQTAAKLTKSNIKGVAASKEVYPGSEDIRLVSKNVDFVQKHFNYF
ncbi:hypothetical protein BaRGS_00024133 [Batillaria attramentaria]|uniref:Uncharacterized protein n=1 Tax=Batillaria attramentaria TaxID=370345 RepID=A0ABD0KC29_9CAEN